MEQAAFYKILDVNHLPPARTLKMTMTPQKKQSNIEVSEEEERFFYVSRGLKMAAKSDDLNDACGRT